ncbi:hypothetical protein BZG36_04951 [Bifiguratus adelaidae]|uniref:Uncharacterized protein n=1 Tax=Bifiguratus adelaidae TaxID=1938954 RepID=A0A261XUN0_9FUNG|nr:hypothetical protein BZG36_04951 [Bifiguratus adelaidae]
MGLINKAINHGVGLTSESIAAVQRHRANSDASHHSQNRNDAPPPYNQSQSPHVRVHDKYENYEEDDFDSDADEEDWELDELEVELAGVDNLYQQETPHKEGVMKFSAPPPPAFRPSVGTLPLPVIIPQRRPGTHLRGFMRAYAPDLLACGVTEADFLRFNKELFQAMQSSKAITVINVAAFAVDFVPSVTAMAVSTAVQFAAGFASAIQSRYQANKFLDNANITYFNPRGLHACVMTYKPVDTSHGILTTRVVELSKQFEKLLPEKPTRRKQFFKRANKFVQDYGDRRVRQQYIDQNPDSQLAGPAPEFLTKRGQPQTDRPTILGTVIRGVTGAERLTRRERRRQRRDQRRAEAGLPRKEGIIHRLMKEDILYLLIAEIPEASRRELDSQSKGLQSLQ